MRSWLAILILFLFGSCAWGQCPGGVCRPAAPARTTVSVLAKPVAKTVEVTKQRIERRPLLRRIFRRSR